MLSKLLRTNWLCFVWMTYFISKEVYIRYSRENWLDEFKICWHITNLDAKLLPNLKHILDYEQYRRLVGKLNYFNVTQTDISFINNMVSQFFNSPCEDHKKTIIRILKFIKRFLGKGLLYDSNHHTSIVCYSNVDWKLSHFDKWSISRYCVSIGSNLISWKSRKIKCCDNI